MPNRDQHEPAGRLARLLTLALDGLLMTAVAFAMLVVLGAIVAATAVCWVAFKLGFDSYRGRPPLPNHQPRNQ